MRKNILVVLLLCLSLVTAMFNSCGDENFWRNVSGGITKVNVMSLTINPTGDIALGVGKTTTLTATVTPDNATNKDITWSSNNTGIATVDTQSGVVTGVSIGTATISATATDDSGVAANKSVTVIQTEVKVTSITVNPSGDVSVVVGQTTTLTATVNPTNASNKNVTWSSLNTGTATVDAQTGVVTGVSAGTATIRATAADGSGVTVNKSVTVTSPNIKVTSITINPSGNVSVEIGKTTTLTASVSPDNATNKNVTWSSLNTDIATIDAQTGVITGVNAGTATIQITAADGSGVTANKSITVSIFSQGDGTSGNPYIITTPVQLDSVRNNLSAYYKLGNNIDLTSYLASGGGGYAKWSTAGWEPISSGMSTGIFFIGSFDGAGYKITGLWINRPSSSDIGLFGGISNSTIKNLGAEIATGGIIGNNEVGGLVGSVGIGGSVTNCYTTGNVSGVGGVGGVAGGVGNAYGSGSVTNCYATGNVSGNSGSVGGVVGSVGGGSSISNCYSTGNVNSTGQHNSNVGGVVGVVDNGSITNCYATGNVEGASNYVGGVIGMLTNDLGNSSIANCVALNHSVACLNQNAMATNEIVGRIAARSEGYTTYKFTLSNSWANSNMTVMANGSSKTLVKGNNTADGADCAAIPSASWWTTTAPNGPGWDTSVWYFANGQLPILQWQR